MATFTVYTYEVWGNKRDGFEVNNRFKMSEQIEIDLVTNGETTSYSTDREIIKALKDADIIKKNCRYDSFTIEGEWDYTLYVNQTNAAVGGYYPICELENDDGYV